ncbi:FixH family protein [Arcticibacter sp.]|uniref:FixH family protein n=1 Tax=Arcticibacter sp. TaxID=1872630 RepID=UPI00388F1959
MNWGTKLIIALGLFMSFIMVLSMRMIFSDKDDLVEKDYYQKGLNYDAEYVKVQKVQDDGAEPVISIGLDKQLDIQFKRPVKGVAKLVHPSNRDKDRAFEISSDTGKVVQLKLNNLTNGYWHLELDWKSDTDSYIFKKKVYLR